MLLKNALLFPAYLGSVFTEAKSFRDNYVLGSKTANRLGLHVARVVLARGIWKIRRAQLFFLASATDRKTYNQNGYVVKNNFLPKDLFNQIVAEVHSYNGKARQCVQGDTITWRVFLDDETLENFPAMNSLRHDRKFIRLLKYTSAKNVLPYLYIQQIRNAFGNKKIDPQKTLHSDTFHPTMKAWLFLEDVTQSMGPLTYVPTSNRLTMERLKWEYRKSINSAQLNDGYSEKGSLRIEEAELAGLGLPAPMPFVVPKNTLVIADTNGFHARGHVEGTKVTRLEIWAYSRHNPFNPFVGFDSGFFRKLGNKVYSGVLDYRDKKAKARGVKATWHTVEGKVI